MTENESAISLLSLPGDILLALPRHLHDIEDFVNLSATCRVLREASAETQPMTILSLAAAASRIFFRPDPHFLVAATARQYATRKYCDGGVDDAYTIDVDPPETFFYLFIYSELFEPAFNVFLETGVVPDLASVETRLEFVKYYIPDWACYACMDTAGDVRVSIRAGRWTLLAPYAPFQRAGGGYPNDLTKNQIGLNHLRESTRWNPTWKGGWGLEGMRMIRPGDLAPWRERLTSWRAKFEGLTDRPERLKVGRQATHLSGYRR
ncbi:hypothetical protein FOMPIDRAFT_1051474 [Fomitopsis schrenkii]|uniref:F-box domain-containing protein n=1 Tax=Fomitopsis schrenkii TaxID=2126942 RepID=S8E4W4_FOMSC|nr:hypothetical protein FOMPIDRAFT_1051474 [Fomitopsis schrenkii]